MKPYTIVRVRENTIGDYVRYNNRPKRRCNVPEGDYILTDRRGQWIKIVCVDNWDYIAPSPKHSYWIKAKDEPKEEK